MSKKKQQAPQFSRSIEAFCSVLQNAQSDFTWNSEKVSELDKLTQDYLHKLELVDLKYEERAKIATQLARVRRERRACKDTTEILSPLVEFLDTDRGRQLFNLVREVLGKTRKVEERMETRVYYPRVLNEEVITSGKSGNVQREKETELHDHKPGKACHR